MQVLAIYMGEVHAGDLVLLDGDRSFFSFTEGYAERQGRPLISLSMEDADGNVVQQERPTQTQLPPWFSNLLPEGLLRRFLADQAGIKQVREFHLLGAIGEDLPGNVYARKLDIVAPDDVADSDPLSDGRDYTQADRLRFSLAGVQMKLSAILDADNSKIAIPTRGIGGDHIVKLPPLQFRNVAENEFSMMEIARSMGMNVPRTALLPTEEIQNLPKKIGDFAGNAFVIERFDRQDGGRVHIEDFAQILNLYPHRKYQKGTYRNIAEVLVVTGTEEDLAEYMARLVYAVLIGNGDMHLKNWSLVYPDGRSPRLAPAYDFLSTLPYTNDTGMALNLYGHGPKKFVDLDEVAFTKFAEKAALSPDAVLTIIKSTVENFMDIWPEAKKVLPIEKRVADAIDRHLKTLQLPGL